MRADLNKVGSSGDYQSGAMKGHAFGMQHTEDLADLGITKQDLNPANSKIFQKKAMKLTRQKRQILGTQVATSAKAFHTMADRPFKAVDEVVEYKPEPESKVKVAYHPTGKVIFKGEDSDLTDVENQLGSNLAKSLKDMKSNIKSSLVDKKGKELDLDLDFKTDFIEKMDFKAKDTTTDNEKAINAFIQTVQDKRKMTPEQINARKVELGKTGMSVPDIDIKIKEEQQETQLSKSQQETISHHLQSSAHVTRSLARHIEGVRKSRETQRCEKLEQSARAELYEGLDKTDIEITQEDIINRGKKIEDLIEEFNN